MLKHKQKLAFYYAKGKEVSLLELTGLALMLGKEVYLPKTWVTLKELTFHRIYSFSDLVPGPFGLMEPDPGLKEMPVNTLELIFVPGVAFDWRGFRLGYGGGYYDRVLASTKALKVGVCYHFQLLGELPVEAHDQPVDLIVTERGIIECS